MEKYFSKFSISLFLLTIENTDRVKVSIEKLNEVEVWTHLYKLHLFLSFCLDKIGLYLRARIWDLRLNCRYYLWTILREMSIFPRDSKTTRRCCCHATNWSDQNRWLKSITLQSKKDLVILSQAQTLQCMTWYIDTSGHFTIYQALSQRA